MKVDSERVLLALVLIALLAIFLPKALNTEKNVENNFQAKQELAAEVKRDPALKSKPENEINLTTTLGKNLYFQLSESDQIRVRRAVQYFCEIKWHEDSCLHYSITCGKKCLTYLKPSAREMVTQAYYRRRGF